MRIRDALNSKLRLVENRLAALVQESTEHFPTGYTYLPVSYLNELRTNLENNSPHTRPFSLQGYLSGINHLSPFNNYWRGTTSQIQNFAADLCGGVRGYDYESLLIHWNRSAAQWTSGTGVDLDQIIRNDAIINNTLSEMESILDTMKQITSYQSSNSSYATQNSQKSQEVARKNQEVYQKNQENAQKNREITEVQQKIAGLQAQESSLQSQVNSFQIGDTIKALNAKQKSYPAKDLGS